MPCVVCSNPSSLVCQRCEEPYCNDVCQRKDWQRHKYFCTKMPPLVSSKPFKAGATVRHDAGGIVAPRPLDVSSSNCVKEAMVKDVLINKASDNNNIRSIEGLAEVAPKPVKLSTQWREHVKLPQNEFFNCRVTCMKKDGSFWIVEEANTERLERLTDNMARNLQNKKPCSLLEIATGDLVAVAFDKKMYRAEVKSLNVSSQCVEVRLIDYGIVVVADAQDVYLAVPRMAEFKAYASRVQLIESGKLEINQLITLRLLGTMTPKGVVQVETKHTKKIPLGLPIQVLAKNSAVTLIKTFKPNVSLKEPQVALFQIKELSSVNDKLNSVSSLRKFTKPFPEKLSQFHLAARTEDGYRRAFLLDYIEQTSMFLVYEMDEGCISITDEVRQIPNELYDYPLCVFAITLADGNSLPKSGLDLSIKFPEEALQEEDVDKLRTTKATLLAQNEPVCAVRVDTFVGRIAKLGLKYWQEPIENGSLVYITHVENYHTIRISLAKTKQHTEIFKSLDSKCLPFSPSSNISVGSIVLVVCPNRGYYRGEVIAELESDRYGVRNIDTGTAHRVPASFLRKSCAFLENLPVSQCRSSIKTICNMPPELVPPNTAALCLLKKLCEQKSEFKVQFSDSECTSLDLIDETVEPNSLIARMLPLMFTSSAVELQPAKDLPAPLAIVPEVIQQSQPDSLKINEQPPLPPSPPHTPLTESKSLKQFNRHYLDDLKRDLLPLGNDFEILVLNSMGVHKTGYVTACFFSSEKDAENFQNLLNLVSIFGDDNKILPGYLPEVGEMCLALYAEDNSWNRGVCLKVSGHEAEILYCDFGNSEVVPLGNIKPIPTELLQTVYATKCFIDGFDKSKDFTPLEEYLAIKHKVNCTVLNGPEPNSRLISIPTLDKILSKELN